jgi:hypothetical protein
MKSDPSRPLRVYLINGNRFTSKIIFLGLFLFSVIAQSLLRWNKFINWASGRSLNLLQVPKSNSSTPYSKECFEKSYPFSTDFDFNFVAHHFRNGFEKSSLWIVWVLTRNNHPRFLQNSNTYVI